jgi:hypothetical protein
MVVTCTTTTSRNGVDTAVCEFAGQRITVSSRNGAEFAVCRALLALNCPDVPLVVINPAGAELLRLVSIHKAAGFTITEGEEGERLAPFSNPAADPLGQRHKREVAQPRQARASREDRAVRDDIHNPEI